MNLRGCSNFIFSYEKYVNLRLIIYFEPQPQFHNTSPMTSMSKPGRIVIPRVLFLFLPLLTTLYLV